MKKDNNPLEVSISYLEFSLHHIRHNKDAPRNVVEVGCKDLELAIKILKKAQHLLNHKPSIKTLYINIG